MTRLLHFLVVGLLSFPCYGQYSYHLEVNTSTLNESKAYFYLLDNNGIHDIKKDSGIFKDNRIHFNGQLNQPSNFARISVVSSGKRMYVDFVIDSGKSRINLELINDRFKRLERSGLNSISQHEYDELTNIYKKYDSLKSSEGKQATMMSPNLYLQMLRAQIKFLESYPDNYFSVLKLYHLSRFIQNTEYANLILTTLTTFSDELKQSPLAQQIYEERTELIRNINASKTGKKVIEFSVKDLNGKIFNNNELKGYNYLIVLSATWCAPCQRQLPKLKKIYETFKDKGLKVVYFNVDDDVTRWKKHVLTNKLSWINVSERLKPAQSKIPKSFGVSAYPTSILIKKTGEIVYNSDQTDPEMYELETNIKQIFK
jgi:thiol-disulfide isomerase/thioredoxin